MEPTTAEPFYVVSDAGKVHLRYRVRERTVDDGRCGIDSNWREVDEALLDELDAEAYCNFCFPWRQ